MTEAIRRFAPRLLDGLTPRSRIPNSAEIPFHLRRKILKQIRQEEGRVPEKLWTDRGDAVEFRTRDIIASQTEIVQSVTMNARYTKGSDLTVKFVEGFPVREVAVEVKSRGAGIRTRKQEIRDSLPPEERNIDGITKWMTENSFILINGGEEKSSEEILNDSFYPQLERIKQKALIDRNIEVQVFPDIQTT